MSIPPSPAVAARASGASRLSLPAWVYHNEEFFALEYERIFMHTWQIVCHINDIPQTGDYFLFEFLNEPIIVVCGDDGRIRAFYNVCRHRAARLLDSENGDATGSCSSGRIRCPYHAWTYDLRGRLISIPHQRAYRDFDKTAWGLPEIEVEIWQGFVFVRFERGGPAVDEMMAPVEDELRPYRFKDMQATGRVTLRPRAVNWKTITDNYIDGLHINVAHTGLRNIAGRSYALDAHEYVHRMTAIIEATSRSGWSERLYCQLLPVQEHLPESRRRLWAYYLLWPNIAFDVYPDQVDFMQMIPLSPTRTLIREISYALPDSSRELRLSRYLNWRINRVVNTEDRGLIERVQQGMASRSFVQGPLSEQEVCLNGFAEKFRQLLPISKLVQTPSPEQMRSALREAG